MSYKEICDSVKAIIKKYQENDPIRLCRYMDIVLLSKPLGTGENSIKGFFFEQSRIKSIIYNNDMSDIFQRIVIAHELGHAVLHSNKGVRTFHDVTVFNQSSILEKEANLFAAELLLDDEEVIDILNDDYTFFEAASMLYVPIELLDFKFRIMKWKGYKIMESPIFSDSNFLKDINPGYIY